MKCHTYKTSKVTRFCKFRLKMRAKLSTHYANIVILFPISVYCMAYLSSFPFIFIHSEIYFTDKYLHSFFRIHKILFLKITQTHSYIPERITIWMYDECVHGRFSKKTFIHKKPRKKNYNGKSCRKATNYLSN